MRTKTGAKTKKTSKAIAKITKLSSPLPLAMYSIITGTSGTTTTPTAAIKTVRMRLKTKTEAFLLFNAIDKTRNKTNKTA